MSPVSGDVQNENALAAVLAGQDVVIHSVKFLSTNASKIIAATKAAKVPRLLVLGVWKLAAHTPQTFPGDKQAPEAIPQLSAFWFGTGIGGTHLLSYLFAPDERTCKFRLGKDRRPRDYMKAREVRNGFSRNQSTRHSSGSRCD